MKEKLNSQKKSGLTIGKFISILLLLLSGSTGCFGVLYYSANSRDNHVYKMVDVVYSDVETSSVSETAMTVSNYEPMEEEAVIEIVQEEQLVVPEISEEGIHRYEFYKDDCTWTDALVKALAAGGYLVRINSRDEFDHIVGLLSDSVFDGMIVFQIGGRRDSESHEYYWVNEYNELYGECINSADYWTAGYGWMANEPSYTDSYDNETTQEDRLVLYNLNGNWALNDSIEGIVSWYPAYSGKVGYIVEFED